MDLLVDAFNLALDSRLAPTMMSRMASSNKKTPRSRNSASERKQAPSAQDIVAYHEAGHATVAYLVGVPVKETSIVPNKERGSLGHSIHPYVSGFQPDVGMIGSRFASEREIERHLRNHIMICFGGVCAESIFTEKPSNKLFGWDKDRHDAVQQADYVCRSNQEVEAYVNWLFIRTENLLRQRLNWTMLESLAHALLVKQKLSGRQVRKALQSGQHPRLKELQAKMRHLLKRK